MHGRFGLACVVLAIAFAQPAHGEAPQPGDLGIFFTDHPTSGADAVLADVDAYEPFDFYVLSYSAPGGIEAYSFAINVWPAMVSGGRLLPEGATDYGVGDDCWIVGTGGICQGESGWFTLVRYAGVMFVFRPPADTQICLGELPGYDPYPGWMVCSPPLGVLRHFTAAYVGCAVINPLSQPAPVPVGSTSFGALKASF